MKIEHIAIWVVDLEGMRTFYERYFQASSNAKYENHEKQFSSYFLTFESGPRIELMHHPNMANIRSENQESIGLAHFAISLGARHEVDDLTASLRRDGYRIVGEPRRTGDGYYESVILDPEGNRIELTA